MARKIDEMLLYQLIGESQGVKCPIHHALIKSADNLPEYMETVKLDNIRRKMWLQNNRAVAEVSQNDLLQQAKERGFLTPATAALILSLQWKREIKRSTILKAIEEGKLVAQTEPGIVWHIAFDSFSRYRQSFRPRAIRARRS